MRERQRAYVIAGQAERFGERWFGGRLEELSSSIFRARERVRLLRRLVQMDEGGGWLYRRSAPGSVLPKLLAEAEEWERRHRQCPMAGCGIVFVPISNQRYCTPHQPEARRQGARRALAAFRARKKRSA